MSMSSLTGAGGMTLWLQITFFEKVFKAHVNRRLNKKKFVVIREIFDIIIVKGARESIKKEMVLDKI